MSGEGHRTRCAIYTRKSTEEGLDQVFNTLDAQREACEAYIKSQAGEGWRTLAEPYDDGGFSGGNMERPAVKRLLADIDAGKVDVIVVYKVDRLTRSLMDFARIVERLDARGVSFVSVTQAFNTTTSMGRLTLNVLLSFAQFEREVTGERIRDKIAASKAKGMWMGGNIPLGYDLENRKLVINPSEAEQVRLIFSRYLAVRSGVDLMRELAAEGVLSKRCTSRSGKERGGLPLSCGALYYLLQNRIYRGEIVHRGKRHPGEHPPIVEEKLFEAVQAALTSRRRAWRNRPRRDGQCPLAGLVVDADGEPMATTFSYGRGGRLYRYYVAGSLDPARSPENPPRRVSAMPLERLVLESVRRLLDHDVGWREALAHLMRVELYARSIQLIIHSRALLEPYEPAESALHRLRPRISSHRLETDGAVFRLIADRSAMFQGQRAGRRPADSKEHDLPADYSELLRSAHRLLAVHSMSPLGASVHLQATAPRHQRQRWLMTLGLLAPSLQKEVLRGIRPCPKIDEIAALPLAWVDQL